MNWTGFSELEAYIGKRVKEFDLIEESRKESLSKLADDIRNEILSLDKASLIFICTHNSRRSHLAHLWAQFAAAYYSVDGISCFSGGTEATAFNPRAVSALQVAGMHITQMDESPNPIYSVILPGFQEGINVFSKKYSDAPNPIKQFVAVMTCSDADEACPIVIGAHKRHAIRYEDPKVFDGSLEETAGYSERCAQIAREMLFLLSCV